METIDQYTIYCTAEQTKKALILRAPIEHWGNTSNLITPTAEQMIGWLEEQGLWIHFCKPNQRPKLLSFSISVLNEHFKRVTIGGEYDSRKKVTLAAIDAALDFLENKNIM